MFCKIKPHINRIRKNWPFNFSLVNQHRSKHNKNMF